MSTRPRAKRDIIIIGPWSLDTCEHCDCGFNRFGFYDDVDVRTRTIRRHKCQKPATCGSGPSAPYGWCCAACEPVMREMFPETVER